MTAYDDYGIPVGAYSEPEGLAHQAWRVARAFVIYRVKPRWQSFSRNWDWRRVVSLGRIFIVIWFFTLHWGERGVFKSRVGECRWENWENWESNANPHRLIFIADPQLVDPHTYPGRPWPLNPLTVKLTDDYLRRSYSRMQADLYPDSVVFLGDLFDGGREWSTTKSWSPEKQYRKYGDSFWMKEYVRFGSIFFNHWGDGGMTPRPGQPGRKIISSLPGNHDLGFAKGVQIPVRKRFNAYFGEGNRVDIVGNHTFVSIDSVSLSAYGQDTQDSTKPVWQPTIDFLDNAQSQKQRLVQEELRIQRGLPRTLPFTHTVIDTPDLSKASLPKFNTTITEFPTILLTHVPLYRTDGTPCGPLREHWPPTPQPKGHETLSNDPRNAIAVRGGYQYQNVLTRDLTRDIASKVGNIEYAFSGDDHDYCEVVHRGYASAGGGIKEITVKSISWAMGVRKPGVVLASLWNPVDGKGERLGDLSTPTLQTHLCLLPDQLGIFFTYAKLFALTVLGLAVRAALIAVGRIKQRDSEKKDVSILPTSRVYEKEVYEKSQLEPLSQGAFHATPSNCSATDDRGTLQVRSAGSRTRSLSSQTKYTYPLVQHAGYHGPDEDELDKPNAGRTRKRRRKGVALFFYEFRWSVVSVAWVVFPWYFWLVWRG